MRARPRAEAELAALFDGGWPASIGAGARAEEHLPTVRSRLRRPGGRAARRRGAGRRGLGRAAGLGRCRRRPARRLRRRPGPGRGRRRTGRASRTRWWSARPRCARTPPAADWRHRRPRRACSRPGRGPGPAGGRPAAADGRAPLAAHPIEGYARWTRADGAAFDPWLRTHLRMGGEIVASAARVADVHGHRAPSGGPGPASRCRATGPSSSPTPSRPLRVDHAADLGTCVEPADGCGTAERSTGRSVGCRPAREPGRARAGRGARRGRRTRAGPGGRPARRRRRRAARR